MIDRNIFIGLGGSGLNTVATLKYKIYANQEGNNPYGQLNENYKFLFCDTDQADIDKNNELYQNNFEEGSKPLIDVNEFINLGEVNPASVYRSAQNKSLEQRSDIENTVLESLNDQMAYGLRSHTLNEGAGAYRMNSRVAFARKAEEFKNRLNTAINQLLNVRGAANEQVQLRYWVVTSCNGGTGSGIFMDVLYLVNMVHQTIFTHEEPKVTLVMYMPRYYIDANNQDTKYLCNAPAVFQELDSFKAMSFEAEPRFQAAPHQLLLRPNNLKINSSERFSPCLSVIPIDIQTERGNHLIDASTMYANTAELLYFVHQSKGQDQLASSFKSDVDNVLEDTILKDHLRYLVPMGYVSLRKPEDEFEQYVIHRLRVDLLTYGLLADFPSNRNRDEEIQTLYSQLIEDIVFKSTDSPLSLTGFIRGQIDQKLNEEFAPSLLLEDGKPRNKLPVLISETTADSLIQSIHVVVNDVFDNGNTSVEEEKALSKQRLIARLEASLWQWAEKQIIRYGLPYVETVLSGLDFLLTERLNEFRSGSGYGSERDLIERIEECKKRFPELYHEAQDITLLELFGRRNAQDIREYYDELRSYIELSGELLLRRKQYQLIDVLCHGDTGIIDRICRHLRKLKVALSMEKEKAEKAYTDLARLFQRSALDITTIYLPTISKFIKGTGWDPDNDFSVLYQKIMERSHRLIPSYGFAPVRTEQEGLNSSVEAFLHQLIEVNKKELINKGLYIQRHGYEHSNLFGCNSYAEQPKKMIEILLSCITETYQQVYKTRLSDCWYGMSLENLFARLTNDQQNTIRTMLNPQLFFSYHTNDIDDSRVLSYVIASSKDMAQQVLGYQDGSVDWRLDLSSSTSVAYMLKAKVGLRLSSYQMYSSLMNEYRSNADKSKYHLHVAFAKCNGDYTLLRLPERPDKDLLLFVKYLLLDKYGRHLPGMIYKPSNIAESELYSEQLLDRTAGSLSMPRPEAIEEKDDSIALRRRNGNYVTYDCEPSRFYSGVFERFKLAVIDNRHEETLDKLLSWLNQHEETRPLFMELKQQLCDELNDAWEQNSLSKEKYILSQMVGFLNNKLTDYSKFVNPQR